MGTFLPMWTNHDLGFRWYWFGLAITKEIIEAHGGQIGVSTEVGRGSTFWFTLPAVLPIPTVNQCRM